MRERKSNFMEQGLLRCGPHRPRVSVGCRPRGRQEAGGGPGKEEEEKDEQEGPGWALGKLFKG